MSTDAGFRNSSARPQPPGLIIVGAYAVVAAAVSTLLPLLVYSTSLAAFGLAHVLSELRYVDARFGARLPRGFWLACAMPLAAVVLLRTLGVLHVVSSGIGVPVEMALVTIVGAVAVPLAFRYARGMGVVAVAFITTLGMAALLAPVHLLLTLAVLHNVTPVGFIVERAPQGRRLRALALASLVFFGVPILVAAGVPSLLLSGFIDANRTALATGPLSDHFGVYLYPELWTTDAAVRLFSAAVTAQLLHYGAVIVWLPRALGVEEKPVLPWPRPFVFAILVAALGVGLLVHFTLDFKGARALYGLAAAVHSWIELPVLLVGFAMVVSSVRSGVAATRESPGG